MLLTVLAKLGVRRTLVPAAVLLLSTCGRGATPSRPDGDATADASGATSPATFPVPDGGDCGGYASAIGGVCVCRSFWPLTCGGGCVNPQTNDFHCGACGHACAAGATCNAGRCGPAPTVLQTAPVGSCGSVDVAVDGATLVWTDDAAGTVSRAPSAGGPPSVIASEEDHPRAVQLRGPRAFWLAGTLATGGADAATIRSAALDGSAPASLVAPAGGVTGFVASPDGQTIYFGASGAVRGVATTPGAQPVIVATDEQNGALRAFALDGSALMFHAYDASGTGAVEVVASVEGPQARCRASLEGGVWVGDLCASIGQLLQGPTQLFSVAAAGAGYWPAASALMMSSLTSGAIDRVALATCEAANDVLALGAGGDELVISTVAGEIGKRPFASAPDVLGVRLARDQKTPRSVASDGARAYWSTGDCQILSTPL